MVVLTTIPKGFLDDLPEEDQQAIREIVGKPVFLNDYDDAGRLWILAWFMPKFLTDSRWALLLPAISILFVSISGRIFSCIF